MSPKRYVKKPVVIEAFLYDEKSAHDVFNWIEENTQGRFDCTSDEIPTSGVSINPATGLIMIATLEGVMRADIGDYVIRGVQGEFYPCKPDIFHASYEEVE